MSNHQSIVAILYFVFYVMIWLTIRWIEIPLLLREQELVQEIWIFFIYIIMVEWTLLCNITLVSSELLILLPPVFFLALCNYCVYFRFITCCYIATYWLWSLVMVYSWFPLSWELRFILLLLIIAFLTYIINRQNAKLATVSVHVKW